MLTFEAYGDYPFAVAIEADDYPRYEAYACLHVSEMLNKLIGQWNTLPLALYEGVEHEVVLNAIALQVTHLHKGDWLSGRKVTSVSLDNYSESYSYKGEGAFSKEALTALKEGFGRSCWV